MFLSRGFYREGDLGMGSGDLFADPSVTPDVQADGVGNDPVDPATVDPAAEPAAEERFTIDGQEFTEAQILEAIAAANNKTQWESTLKQKQEDVAALERAVTMAHEAMRQQQVQPVQPQYQQPEPTPEELRDAFLDNPAQFMAWMSQNTQSLVEQKAAELTTRAQTESQFLQQYPDYNQVVNSPEFQSYMASHPGYNQVNAYFAMKLEQSAQTSEKMKQEAYKEAEAKILSNLKAKGQLGSVHTQPGGVPTQASTPPATKQELVKDLAAKIMAARQQGG